jgi:hypothetical protein
MPSVSSVGYPSIIIAKQLEIVLPHAFPPLHLPHSCRGRSDEAMSSLPSIPLPQLGMDDKVYPLQSNFNAVMISASISQSIYCFSFRL